MDMLPLRFAARRAFSTSLALKNADTIPVAPAKRPVGAFRGGYVPSPKGFV